MPAPGTISPDKLIRLIGTPGSPILIDVRNDEDFGEDPRLLPSSVRRNYATVDARGLELAGKDVVVICHARHQPRSGLWRVQRGRDECPTGPLAQEWCWS